MVMNVFTVPHIGTCKLRVQFLDPFEARLGHSGAVLSQIEQIARWV